ncbi:MAG: exonuclease SbcCD subunit D [Lachnospiraceae bacterium]|nr:exonuclease SbcCD subunit D [Lachnospiraceae bacterium]
MRFFHISDLHIGLKLFNRDLSEDQNYIFQQIVEAAEREKPDAVVIAGDIYDKAVPSAEAVTLFDEFVSALAGAVPNAQLMMISGNHDSAPRVNLFRSVLRDRKIHMVGLPPGKPEDRIEQVVLEDAYGAVHFYLLPFVKPSMVRQVVGCGENESGLSYEESIRRLIEREQIDTTQRNVLVSHQFYVPAGNNADSVERMDSEIRTIGNIDEVHADVLDPFDYAALGHIHKPMMVGRDCLRYSGTPLACSVSEAGQEKGIVLVDMKEKGDLQISILPLVPLREVRVIKGSLHEVLNRSCEDYVTVELNDQVDYDVLDMQDRLRHAFPNLLEIRRVPLERKTAAAACEPEKEADPMELCRLFLADLDEEEERLLRDVMNEVMEGGES